MWVLVGENGCRSVSEVLAQPRTAPDMERGARSTPLQLRQRYYLAGSIHAGAKLQAFLIRVRVNSLYDRGRSPNFDRRTAGAGSGEGTHGSERLEAMTGERKKVPVVLAMSMHSLLVFCLCRAQSAQARKPRPRMSYCCIDRPPASNCLARYQGSSIAPSRCWW